MKEKKRIFYSLCYPTFYFQFIPNREKGAERERGKDRERIHVCVGGALVCVRKRERQRGGKINSERRV